MGIKGQWGRRQRGLDTLHGEMWGREGCAQPGLPLTAPLGTRGGTGKTERPLWEPQKRLPELWGGLTALEGAHVPL